MENKICLFGTLVRYARVAFYDGKYDPIAIKMFLNVDDVKDFENNVKHPTELDISNFSKAHQIDIEKLNYFIFHDYEPKSLRLKFRKYACVKISQLMYKYIDFIESKPL